MGKRRSRYGGLRCFELWSSGVGKPSRPIYNITGNEGEEMVNAGRAVCWEDEETLEIVKYQLCARATNAELRADFFRRKVVAVVANTGDDGSSSVFSRAEIDA